METEQNDRWLFRSAVFLLFLIAVGLIWAILGHHGGENHTHYDRDKCRSNLKNIAAGCVEYLWKHGEHFPDRIEELVELGLTPEILLCPATEDMRATGTREEIMAAIAAGKNLSYIYVGRGLTANSPPNCVVAYEPLVNHRNEGINVLFADFHVRWLEPKEAAEFLAHVVCPCRN